MLKYKYIYLLIIVIDQTQAKTHIGGRGIFLDIE